MIFFIKIWLVLRIKIKFSCLFFLYSVTYGWYILQFNFNKSLNLELKNTGTILLDVINFLIYWIWTWKILGLPYWTRTDFICWIWPWKILGLPYWIWIDFICLQYIGLGLENTHHRDYLTVLGLILLNTGLELINQPGCRYKIILSWIKCFLLPFNIVLIYAAFTAPAFIIIPRRYLHRHFCDFYAALGITCHFHICQ